MSLWLWDIKCGILITGPDAERADRVKSNYFKTIDSVGK